AGVVIIDLVGELAPGDADLVRVHHHDVVAHVDVRAVIGLVLALQAVRDLGGKPSESLVARIDDEPVAADTAGLGEYGFHKLQASKEGSGAKKGREVYCKGRGRCKARAAADQLPKKLRFLATSHRRQCPL